MKTVRKRCNTQISIRFWTWILEKLGYEVDFFVHLDPFKESYYGVVGKK